MNNNNLKKFSLNSKIELENCLNQIQTFNYQQIESISYNWFIRFIFLKYIDINNYFPKYKLFNNKDNSHSFKENLIINAINKLSFLPLKLFSNISQDEFKALPYIINSDFIKILNNDILISKEEWKHIEIIGWLHQNYISENNSNIIKNNQIYNKDEIPIATQVFTPNWIVKYMVDNTLGRFWMENNKNSLIINKLEYFLFNEYQKNTFQHNELIIENIKLLDPAVGTGNILLYSFDLFYEIYLESGYNPKNIPLLILNNNLFGLDIDENVIDITKFSLIIKAIDKNPDFIYQTKDLKLNINAILENNDFSKNVKKFLYQKCNKKYLQFIDQFIDQFNNAKIYGSLTETFIFPIEFFHHIKDISKNTIYEDYIQKLINQTNILNNKYNIIVCNPPYIARKNLPNNLKNILDKNFSIAKFDLFSAFMIFSMNKTFENGHIGLTTPYVWMFISSYKELRKYIINKKEISSLIQLEYSSFPNATVPICAFTLKNKNNNIPGEYIKLSDFKGVNLQKQKTLEAIKNPNSNYRYTSNSNNFKNIIQNPISYWVSKEFYNVSRNSYPLKNIANARQGIATGNNKKYLKLWHEVDFNNIGFGYNNIDDFLKSGKKYAPYNKGGRYRKWYGNFDYVIKFDKENYINLSNSGNKLPSKQFYFKEGLTWSFISSSYFSVRYTPKGSVFDVGGSSIFTNDNNIFYITGLLCSKISKAFIDILNPTLNHQVGNIKNIPIIYSKKYAPLIEKIVKENISISKIDWDSFETSWNFRTHPLIDYKIQGKNKKTLEESFNTWIIFTNNQFKKLKENEELLNEIFINIYNLNKDLNKYVDDDNITIYSIQNKRPNNNKKFSYIIDKKTAINSFISFFIGCTLGRYSITKEGLITDNYICHYYPPMENLPIYIIEDKLREFLNILFIENSKDENINFLYNTLNLDSKQSFENYFHNEFINYHKKVYKNKNIYSINSNYITYKF